MFNDYEIGNKVEITIYDSGIVQGNILLITKNKKEIILENVEYMSTCYLQQSIEEEPVIHIIEEEVCEIKLIA